MSNTKSSLPEWIEKVRELYDEGASDVEICKELRWSQKQFDDQYNQSEGFRALIDFGRLSSKAWWISQGRKNLQNRSFGTPLYALHMKNRFGWAEKQETTSNGKDVSDMSQDELKQEFQKSLPQIAKYLKSEGMTDAKVLQLVGKDK